MSTKQGSDLVPMASDEEIKSKFLYMKPLVFYSKLIYMWPSLRYDHGFKFHFIVCFILINCILTQLSFSIQILKQYQNLNSTTELIDLATAMISAIFRFCYIYCRGKAHLKLVHLIHTKFINYPFIPTRSRITLDHYYKFGIRTSLGYSLFIFFWLIQMCVGPVIGYIWALSTRTNSSEFIPYPVLKNTYTPFDIHTQPNNALYFLHQSVCLIYFALIYTLVDSFWHMVIILTIGQFVLIKDSINTVAEIFKKKTSEVSLMRQNEILELERVLKRCIKHHQFVREFTHIIEDISNPIILVDYLYGLSVCFILLDVTISLNDGDWNKLMYSVEYFVTSIIHMFFFNWLGNELAEKEKELAGAVYQIPWYKCPTLKTNLLLISIQCRRPYRLTGGKMYKLTLDFFTSTLKVIFSYFTFFFRLRK